VGFGWANGLKRCWAGADCIKLDWEERGVGCRFQIGSNDWNEQKMILEFWQLQKLDFKWIWTISNQGFWIFSKIGIWTLVKDLDQINLNSSLEYFEIEFRNWFEGSIQGM
jgi:hypothetical protein